MENNMDKYNLNRFVEAQKESYQQALHEIKAGKKVTHWVWYIFPQLKGFGHSYNATFYGIEDANEAMAYAEHPVLGMRLREITTVLLQQAGGAHKIPIEQILGSIDTMKVKSCMTLFEAVTHEALFTEVLDRLFGGKRDMATLEKSGLAHTE